MPHRVVLILMLILALILTSIGVGGCAASHAGTCRSEECPASDDPDGDGVPTETERACATDPTDGTDFPREGELRGAGREEDPYRICLPSHLRLLSELPERQTAHARLGDDLDLSGVSLGLPIGTRDAPYEGVFDGDGFVMDGLAAGSLEAPRPGLFAHIGPSGVVEHVTLTRGEAFAGSALVDRNEGTLRDVMVSGVVGGMSHLGLLVNRNLPTGVVEDCMSEGTVTAVRSHAGGLVGENDGLIQRSFSLAAVAGENRTGGLVGSGSGVVRESFASGSVNGRGSWMGGLVGSARDGAVIENAYALGAVGAGTGEAGGVVGVVEGVVLVRHVYARNAVRGAGASGGVIGVDRSRGQATIESCFFDRALTERDPLCVGRTATQLADASSYEGFDFRDTWRLTAGESPTATLAWDSAP